MSIKWKRWRPKKKVFASKVFINSGFHLKNEVKTKKKKRRSSIQKFPRFRFSSQKILRFSSNSKVKTKKKRSSVQKFHKCWCSSQKSFDCPRILRWRPKNKKKTGLKFPQILVLFSKIMRISTNFKVKTKKKGPCPKICATSHEIWCESTKITKKQFLLTNSRAISTILRVLGLDLHSSSFEPVNFFGAQSSLEGHNFPLGGHKQSFGGNGPEMPPVAPGLYFWLIGTRNQS